MQADTPRKWFYKQVIKDISLTKDYMRRWNLTLPFRLGTIKLHNILRADTDRCQHNHPWWFVRIVLWGGYEEVFGEDNRIKVLRPGSISYCQVNFRHRITRLLNGESSWSLVITGPAVQRWGFFTRLGFQPWKPFVNALREARIAWCEDGSSVEPEMTRG